MERVLERPALPGNLKERLATVIAEQRPRLRAFVRRQVDDLAEAEDVVQDAFTELTAAANELLAPIEHVAAWLKRVARNRIIDRYRASNRALVSLYSPRPAVDEGVAEERLIEALVAPARDEPEEAHRRSRLVDALLAALEELPPAQREVFLAHELEGLSFKTLAATTGVGINTLLSRKHAAIAHLRKRLADFRQPSASSEST